MRRQEVLNEDESLGQDAQHLGGVTDTAVTALLARLDDNDLNVRQRVATALGAFGANGASVTDTAVMALERKTYFDGKYGLFAYGIFDTSSVKNYPCGALEDFMKLAFNWRH